MASPPPQEFNPQQFKPAFNQEELRVLRECNVESFYYRCIPFAAAFGAATFMAMRQGILKTSERFGYTPKMIAAGIVGYFTGKLSYQNACAEKLMQLPDSPIGEALRKRKGRVSLQESFNMEPGFSVGSSGLSEPQMQPIFDDHRPDVRDHSEGLDEYERGVTDSLTPYTELNTSAPHHQVSYEELRRQNREEYVNKITEKYRRPPVDTSAEISPLPADDLHLQPPPPTTYKPPPVPKSTVKKNQWGDEVFE